MKTFFAFLTVLLLLLPVTVHAGDIPEAYLADEAQMFFGEVVAYHPDKAEPSISVSPVKTIKGDVREGTLQHYVHPNVIGSIELKRDAIYLFAYLDDTNGLDVFDVTTYDTRTLKLKNVEGRMWERFEDYLNDGAYGIAHIEGRSSASFDARYLAAAIVVLPLALLGCRHQKQKDPK